jgi:tetratricopeptide (TPR) repeat protein
MRTRGDYGSDVRARCASLTQHHAPACVPLCGVRELGELAADLVRRGFHVTHGILGSVHNHPPIALRLALATLISASLAACSRSHDGAPGPAAPLRKAASAPESAPKPHPRVKSEALARLRKALDMRRLDDVNALIAHAADAGAEAALLEARAAELAGRKSEAMRLLESAIRNAPGDPSVYATAAEIYAAEDKTQTAWAELHRGEDACGESPELWRARGILAISQTGGAQKGLEWLEKARQVDPEIPFIDRALGQAHLLVGKACLQALEHDQAPELKSKDKQDAIEHARASITFDPDEIDAHRFLADALAAADDFEGARAILEELVAKGEKLEPELASMCKRAGIAAMLEHDRAREIEHFLAARKHGLTNAELGFGAQVLAEEAQSQVDAGVQAYEKGDLDVSETHFRRALELEPDELQAENHLAIVLFKKQRYADAAKLWQRVLATARDEKLELPEPVHLNLAKAQVQGGDKVGAELTLEEYLDRQPSGEWAGPTREMLTALGRAPGGR